MTNLTPEAVAQMVADVKQEITVECVNSEMDRLVAGRIMKALTALAAENAMLWVDLAETEALEMQYGDVIERLLAGAATLRASEAAAREMIDRLTRPVSFAETDAALETVVKEMREDAQWLTNPLHIAQLVRFVIERRTPPTTNKEPKT